MIGIDIVEVQRIEKAYIKNNNFLNNIFTENEINYSFMRKNKFQTLAGKFAAKEAYKKAIDINAKFKEIEILNYEDGKPYISINGKIIETVEISISHEKNYAVAIIIKR